MKIAGAISGTSLDGIDVAICNVAAHDGRIAAACERFATIPFDRTLRERILAAYPPARHDALEVSALHASVGEAFGDAIAGLAAGTPLDAVASHGVTLAHDGEAHHTLQIGDAFRIRERAHATVVYDFRSADTAAGGSGAPLVPFVDALLFADRAPCVALNLGGIANLTVLPQGIAFDSGPANLLIDTYVTQRSGGTQRYDRDGALARAGSPDAALLARMLADPYFAAPPPKTTGRERYGAPWVEHHRHELDALGFEDAVATLTALTICTVADALRSAAPGAALIIVSGGGARNPMLVEGLRAALPRRRRHDLGRVRHRCRCQRSDRLRRPRLLHAHQPPRRAPHRNRSLGSPHPRRDRPLRAPLAARAYTRNVILSSSQDGAW